MKDGLEWMRCSVKDVNTALTELRSGKKFSGTHHDDFPMRREQANAVEKTYTYYQSIWADNRPAFIFHIHSNTYQLPFKFTGTMQIVDWKKTPSTPAAAGGSGETQWVQPEKFFDQLPEVMKNVPPLPGEEALYGWFKSVLDAAPPTDPISSKTDRRKPSISIGISTPRTSKCTAGIFTA